MPLISGSVPSLINGVSQQPATLRMPTQGSKQVNGFSHVSRGLQKRPCTEHVAKIVGIDSTTSNDVFIHTIRRSEDEAYALIVKGGDNPSANTNKGNAEMRLYDLTGFATGTPGSEVFIHPDTVSSNITANGAIDVSYLSNFSGTNSFEPNKLGATTIADFTFLLNKTTKVKKKTGSSEHHPARPYEALIHFKVGDFDSDYKIVVTEFNVDADGEINKDSSIQTHEAKYETPDNKTVSRTENKETESLNNAEAVVVGNIAKTFFNGNLTHLTTGVLDADTTSTPSGVKLVPANANCVSTGSITGAINATTLNAATTGRNPWTVRYDVGESLIYISNDSKPFVVECTDGKGDAYMVAINGSDEVSSFGKLPGSKHPNNGSTADTGFVAKVSGDKDTGQDDYYVKWTGSVWKESARPKYPALEAKHCRNELDPTTLPLRLFKAFGTVNGVTDQIYFILKTVPWEERTVGDDTINPFPSFCNYDESEFPAGLFVINDIFFHNNRLGFISDENVILSSAANYYQFFATTVLSVLDTAVIDVAVSNNQVAILKSAIPFQETLLLFSDLQQFKLSSDQFLTPTSVTVDVATNFETSTVAKPVPAGKTIFFPFLRGAYSGIREYFIEIASQTNDANEITSHVPELMEGTVAKLAVSSNEEVLCVLGNTDRKKLYVYKYYYADKEKLQSSWSTWSFDGDIVDMSFLGSVAFLLIRRGVQIYLEKMNLSVDNAINIMDDKIEVRLDRRVRLKPTLISDYTPTPSGAWQTGQTHTNVTQTTTSGGGTGIKFNITTDGSGNPTFKLANNGINYSLGNTIVFTDPGNTSNTATVTVSEVGTQANLDQYYDDVDHDKVAGTTIRKLGDDKETSLGTKIKIDADGAGLLNKPRPGQTFTSAHDATITYTVVESEDINTSDTTTYTIAAGGTDTASSSKSVIITVTPSISRDAPIPHNTVLTFKEREAVYVVETGEVINSANAFGILERGTDFSKAKGNITPDIFVGVPYEFQYEFSEQFIKSGETTINSGRLQLRNFEIAFDRTGFFEVEVSPRPFDDRLRKINKRAFTGKKIGTLFLGEQKLQTGVFRVPVYCNSKDVKITVKSDSWLPLAIQSADWEAFQMLRNQRI